MDLHVQYPADLDQRDAEGNSAVLVATSHLGDEAKMALADPRTYSDSITHLYAILDDENEVVFTEPGEYEPRGGETLLGTAFPDGSFITEPSIEIDEATYTQIRKEQGMLNADMGLSTRDLDEAAWETLQELATRPWGEAAKPLTTAGSPYLLEAIYEAHKGRIVEPVRTVMGQLEKYNQLALAVWAVEHLDELTDEELGRFLFGTKNLWLRNTWMRMAMSHQPQTCGARLRAAVATR